MFTSRLRFAAGWLPPWHPASLHVCWKSGSTCLLKLTLLSGKTILEVWFWLVWSLHETSSKEHIQHELMKRTEKAYEYILFILVNGPDHVEKFSTSKISKILFACNDVSRQFSIECCIIIYVLPDFFARQIWHSHRFLKIFHGYIPVECPSPHEIWIA